MMNRPGKSVPVQDEASHLDGRAAQERMLPSHLVSLEAGRWALWRCVCLRGAGFPAEQALALAALTSANLADQMRCTEQEVEYTRREAIEALDLLRRLHANTELGARVVEVLRIVRNTHFPQKLTCPPLACKELTAFLLTYQRCSALHEQFERAFATETIEISRAIHASARSERFREAVLWQNRRAVHTGMESLLRHPPEKTAQISKQRSNEALVANYLQRYCMKNDSIGFFGPVGYGTIRQAGEALHVRPGPQLLAKRGVYFEGWGTDALADAFSHNNALRPWCVPRLMPHVSISFNATLHVPFAGSVLLSRLQASILRACDGHRTAREIAQCLLADHVVGSEDEVYAALEQLKSAKRILWSFDLPPEGAYPERALLAYLERIDDETLRTGTMAMLDRLLLAREAVARAAGSAEQLDEALEAMQTTFIEATGLSPTRSDGKMYAARTLLYEDCRRDVELELGPDIVHTLAAPLSLLLSSARWFTSVVAERYHEAFLAAYCEMREEQREDVLNFADFWLWVQSLLFDEDERLADPLVGIFQEIWEEILALPTDQHHVTYSSEELRPAVLAAFDAPGPGWHAACYHSPDVLIDASSPDAIRKGDYQLILGEFHIAMNTLQISAFLSHHDAPEDLLLGAAHDVPAPRVLPVRSRGDFPISRVRSALITPKDVRLTYIADACTAPSEHKSVSLADLVIERVGEQLLVRTLDQTLQWSVIEVFAEFLSWQVVNCFKMFPARPHTPRVSIDRLIIARETWRFMPAELPFAQEKLPTERFRMARAWAASHELPRFVFVKVPTEQKPCFIDFASPIYVDMLAKMARQNGERQPDERSIVISEMLPAPDRLWLPDAQGQRYTSELRFVAVEVNG